MLASFLALVLFCAQVVGQSLSAQTLSPSQNPTLNSGDTSVRTIRLAQADTGSRPSFPGDIDIDPPIIDHESLETGVSGEPQQFSAVVVDDRGLTHVVLFHRDRSGAQYSDIEMEQVGSTNEYTAVIDTSEGQDSVEYYIEALDTGGNRVLKGFPFFPLERQLDPGPTSTAEVTEEASGSDKRLIYVALGVAAVGLAALLLSGGGDNDNPEPEPGATVPISITITPP